MDESLRERIERLREVLSGEPDTALQLVALRAAAEARGRGEGVVLDYIADHMARWPGALGHPPCPCDDFRQWLDQMPTSDAAARGRWLDDFIAHLPARARPEGADAAPWLGCRLRGWLIAEGWTPEVPNRALALRCAQGLGPSALDTLFDGLTGLAGPAGSGLLAVLSLGDPSRGADDALFAARTSAAPPSVTIEALHPESTLEFRGKVRPAVTLTDGQRARLGDLAYTFWAEAPPATVSVRLDGNAPTTFRMTRATVTIGRVPGNDIRISWASVSRRQCVIFFAGGRYWVQDLNSAGGTYLNGRKMRREPLSLGDRIQFGDVTVTLVPEGTSPPEDAP